MHNESIHKNLIPSCRVIMTASWNSAGNDSQSIQTFLELKFSVEVVRSGPAPQQWLKDAYFMSFPRGSQILMGLSTLPTSSNRFGRAGLALPQQAPCFGFVKQSSIHFRAKAKHSSDPESDEMSCALPSVGQGARVPYNRLETWNGEIGGMRFECC